MPWVPPIVYARSLEGPAYLVAWERSDAGWDAHIAWVEMDGEAWKVRSRRVAAGDVRRIADQDYRDVPRR